MGYNTVEELLALAESSGKPLHRIIAEEECARGGGDIAGVRAEIEVRYGVMWQAAHKALKEPQTMPLNLISGQASRQHNYAQWGGLAGSDFNEMMAMALSCSEANASMGRICAAPTAGACGILPAVLITAGRRLGSSEEQLIDALLVAGGFGAIMTRNATVSGAEGGCQAECGVAAAMAAAGAVYLAGGEGVACANACAIALINCMGLICDPVAGLVQLPCSFRNASQSANALASADMALAGQESVIPCDQVIEALLRVGRSLPRELRETALGGIAATPAGKKLHVN